ncbi:MAG: peptide deformylase, partial [Clostridia bacterium]
RRAVVVDIGEGLNELVNPEIIAAEGEQTGPEGCLSVPGRSGMVLRPNFVTVRAQDAQGNPIVVTGEGFFARALCHEIDHLDGVLYVDKMEQEIFAEDENAEESQDDADAEDGGEARE